VQLTACKGTTTHSSQPRISDRKGIKFKLNQKNLPLAWIQFLILSKLLKIYAAGGHPRRAHSVRTCELYILCLFGFGEDVKLCTAYFNPKSQAFTLAHVTDSFSSLFVKMLATESLLVATPMPK